MVRPVIMSLCICAVGYLSTNAKGIMCELLKFICSVVENGNSANDAILSLLPNLFGPGQHIVLCHLLLHIYIRAEMIHFL